jgi:hypothetical protein
VHSMGPVSRSATWNRLFLPSASIVDQARASPTAKLLARALQTLKVIGYSGIALSGSGSWKLSFRSFDLDNHLHLHHTV